MGAGGCQCRPLTPRPTGWSPTTISTCVLHGSYFVLLVTLLVPTPLSSSSSSPLAPLVSSFSILALSALLAIAVAGGDRGEGTWLGTQCPGGATGVGWGRSALSHLLTSPQGSGQCWPPTRHGAGGTWPVLPQEEPRHPLTSTLDR